MNDRSTIVALLAVLGLSGALFVSNGSAPSSVPTSAGGLPSAGRQTGKGAGSDGADPIYDLLCKYYGVDDSRDALAQFTGANSHVIIATIADPTDSHLGYTFDQQLEALRLAAVDAGYQPDRFYLPWEETATIETVNESETSEKTYSDRTDKEPANKNTWTTTGKTKLVGKPEIEVENKLEAIDTYPPGKSGRTTTETASSKSTDRRGPRDRHLYRDTPGALLFRRPTNLHENQAPPALLMLLVGETPTLGVHPNALRRALQLAKNLSNTWERRERGICKGEDGICRSDDGDTSCYPLWLVGPNYSGSATSLRNTFELWLSNEQQHGLLHSIHFISGSATSDSLKKKLALGVDVSCLGSFASMAHPDSVAIARALTNFLKEEHRANDGEVGVLHEADTSYGANYVADATDEEKRAKSQFQQLQLPYPIHVSEMRSAYQKEGRLNPDPRSLLSRETRSSLSLQFETQGEPSDVPRTFSPITAATVADRMLTTLFESLAREGIRFLVIVGSDAQDKLFLARLIHQHAPNVQLIIVDSDVQYTHPEYEEYLLGTWIISSYPGTPSTQRWDPTESGRRIQFANSEEEGLYNAVSATIFDAQCDVDQMDCGKRKRPALADYRWDGKDGPALWLTVVGRGNLWPVERLHADQDEQGFLWKPQQPPRESGKPEPPKLLRPLRFDVLSVALALLAIYWCVLYWAPFVKPDVESRALGFRTIDWLGRARGTSKQRWNAAMVFAVALASLAYPTWVAVAGAELEWRVSWHGWAGGGLLLFAAALVTGSLIDGIFQAFGPSGRFLWRQRCPWLNLAVCQLTAVCLAVFCVLPCLRHPGRPLDPVDDALQFERSVALNNGVSPLLPVILLAACALVLAYAAARRQRLAATFDSVAEFAWSTPELKAIVKKIRGSLTSEVSAPHVSRRLAAGGTAIALLLMVYVRGVPTLEGKVFDWAVASSFAALAAMLTDASLRFQGMWQQLRLLLRWLAAGALADAFDRLPAETARSFGLRLSSEPMAAAELCRALEQVSLLELGASRELFVSTTVRGNLQAATQGWANVRQWCEQELAKTATGRRWAYAYETETLRTMSWLADRVSTQVLGPYWKEKAPVLKQELDLGEARSADGTARDMLARYRTSAVQNSETFCVRLAEDFVAGQIINFVSYVFLHLKNLLVSGMIGALLLVLTVASYPFQPQQMFVSLAFGLFGALVTMAMVVIIQADRNEVLSRVADRTPNRVNFDRTFLSQVFMYAVVPLAAALASQFPALNTYLSGVLGLATK